MVRVSILVPFYGAEQYIVQCARSLFQQSYPHCEFIFVDDASRDMGVEKLKRTVHEFEHLSESVKIIECAQNGGVAAARNIAINAATGDYILFVDADDWVDDQIVEKLVLCAVENESDICNAWCESVMADGGRDQTPTFWVGSPHRHLKAILGQSHIVPNHVRGMLIRRSILEDHALRFTPGVDFGEDYSLLPQIVYYSKVLSTVKEYLYFYRIENMGSYMNNIGVRQIDNYIAAQAIVARFVEELPNAANYSYAVALGRLNIKKWIFRRGADPKEYDAKIFGDRKKTIYHPLLWLYNWVIDSRSAVMIKLFSIIINAPLYIKTLFLNLS